MAPRQNVSIVQLLSTRFRDFVLAFLESASAEQFWEAMTISSTTNQKEDPPLVSPLRLLIKTYPELAKMALDRCMGTNLASSGSDRKEGVIILADRVTADHHELEVAFNYELLDDAFVVKDREKSKETPPQIVESEEKEEMVQVEIEMAEGQKTHLSLRKVHVPTFSLHCCSHH